MKIIRRLCLRGNACYVSVPHQLREFLRWDIGDAVVIENANIDELRIRRVRPEDLVASSMSPMNLELPRAVSK